MIGSVVLLTIIRCNVRSEKSYIFKASIAKHRGFPCVDCSYSCSKKPLIICASKESHLSGNDYLKKKVIERPTFLHNGHFLKYNSSLASKGPEFCVLVGAEVVVFCCEKIYQ